MSTNAASTSSDINSLDLLLILLVTVSWGLNYPIMKFVVTSYPPLTFRAFTFTIGCVLLGAYALRSGESLHVPMSERWLAFKLGMPNMVLWHLGLIYGMTLLNSGRAAIVGYTMPVWALLASVLMFKNTLTLRGMMGVFCSLLATFLLARDEMSNFAGQPLGLVCTLAAAMAWGVGNAMMKNCKISISSITLTFWMLMLAAICFIFLALVFEQDRWAWPTWIQFAAILYAGGVTFAISYVAWFRVARKLTPVASGLSIMLVPMIGLIGGYWMLNEVVAVADITALLLILLAMAIVLIPGRKVT
ncbi:DMT family transporter [Limnohabitans sp.]|uniref:DMT family transporter n=1 Tax=Limnohabitans sp. TaxID=1907725 RepID=UPI003342B144